MIHVLYQKKKKLIFDINGPILNDEKPDIDQINTIKVIFLLINSSRFDVTSQREKKAGIIHGEHSLLMSFIRKSVMVNSAPYCSFRPLYNVS